MPSNRPQLRAYHVVAKIPGSRWTMLARPVFAIGATFAAAVARLEFPGYRAYRVVRAREG